MFAENWKFIAKIILKNKLVSEEKVQECLAEAQERHDQGESIRLTEIFLDKSLLNERQITAVLNAYNRASRIQLLNKTIPGFQFIKEIGNGTGGTVYRARQKSIGREVAVKILDEEMATDPIFIKKFHREGKSAARLNDPNIIQAIDAGEAGEFYFFVMEYVDGETLQSVMKRERRLDEARATELILHMAYALEHAHEFQMIHRDIKPANILINRHGKAKMCDLGLARPVDSDTKSGSTTGAAGTPAYMSPEQSQGKTILDIRSDIFSLGSTFYHAVTGRIPFSGNSLPEMFKKLKKGKFKPPRELCPSLSVKTEKTILNMMEAKRDNRPESPEYLVKMLEKLLSCLTPAPPIKLITTSGNCLLPPQGKRDSNEFSVLFLLVESGRKKGKHFLLSRNNMVVGRSTSSDIRIRETWISRTQFAIIQTTDEVKIQVLSESNTTHLNDKPIKEAILNSGDKIVVGKTQFRFELKPNSDLE